MVDATSLRSRLRHPPSLAQVYREKAIEALLSVCATVSLVAIFLIFLFLFKEGIIAFKLAGVGDFIVAKISEVTFDPVTEEFTKTETTGYVWQPVSDQPKLSFVPLVWGSLLIAALAATVSTIVGIACGLYLSEMAGRKLRGRLKPLMELLVSIPTVVIGFFMLAIIAYPLRAFADWAGAALAPILGDWVSSIYTDTFNAFIGALGVSIVIIPVIASLVDDSLQSVPQDLRDGSFALGATRWQTSWRVVLPAGFSGVAAAVILGFGRALGETMIVVMCAGNAAQLSANPFDSVTTMTARIATEMGTAGVGSLHQHTLFLVGSTLVTVTFFLNLLAEVIVQKYRSRIVS
ncbi:MAG: phosphate ABC transporter permease subunit PstC [Candidatus Sumerlaeia bacterium]|nr:phosphate ABC transporter permease subunit PstC [Candidatus Sumerlaeia bacterium]